MLIPGISIAGGISANAITVGSLRGIIVQAGAFMTHGSYLTKATALNDSTVYVQNTVDFPSSGSAEILDSTNDRNIFSYSGISGNALTGCTGILAHKAGVTCIPLVKDIVIDDNVSELRFFGNRGDGTIEEIGSISLVSDASGNISVGNFGTSDGSNIGVWGQSKSNSAIRGTIPTSGTGYSLWCDFNGASGGGHILFTPLQYGKPNYTTGVDTLVETNEASVGNPAGYYDSFVYINTLRKVTLPPIATQNNFRLIGPLLVYDSGPLGSAVTSMTISGLDGNTHGGYEFEFIINVNGAGPPRYRLYAENDQVDSDYLGGMLGYTTQVVGSNVATTLLDGGQQINGDELIITGIIGLTPGLVPYAHFRVSEISDASLFMKIWHKKAAVSNLTRLDIVSSVASGIGVNSRFRLWRKR